MDGIRSKAVLLMAGASQHVSIGWLCSESSVLAKQHAYTSHVLYIRSNWSLQLLQKNRCFVLPLPTNCNSIMSTKPKSFRNPLEALAAGMRLKPSTTPQHKVDRRTIPRSRIGQGKRGHPIGSKPLIPLKKRLGNPNKPKMHGLQPMFWCGIEGKWIIDKEKIRIVSTTWEWHIYRLCRQ